MSVMKKMRMRMLKVCIMEIVIYETAVYPRYKPEVMIMEHRDRYTYLIFVISFTLADFKRQVLYNTSWWDFGGIKFEIHPS